MYSQVVVDSLVNLIGFGSSEISGVVITQANEIGTSGRIFPSFNRSITVKNIHETIEEQYLGEVKFNQFLLQSKVDAVKASLVSVLNQNRKYQSDVDYSDIILSNPEIFEDCIGYSLSASMLEMMITSTRMNISEREASLSYSQLKIELDGAKNDDGHVLAFGLRSKFNRAVNNASKSIFKDSIKITSKKVW